MVNRNSKEAKMNFSLDFKSPVPLYAQLKEQILMSVASGKIARGDRLPSVRELSTALRINPNTVIQCYRELERDSIVVTRKGQGTFVSEEASAMPIEKRREILSEEIERLLVKAFHLGATPEEVAALVKESIAGKLGTDGKAATGTSQKKPGSRVPAGSDNSREVN